MAGGEATSASRELDQTPTWAVASVCAGLIIISIALEKGLHRVGHVSINLHLFFYHFLFKVSFLWFLNS